MTHRNPDDENEPGRPGTSDDDDVPMPPDDPARGPPIEEPPKKEPPRRATRGASNHPGSIACTI